MRLGTALVLSAPSGAGKTTLVRKLLSDYPDFGYSVSCTTRKPRPGEVDGRDYHFLSRDDFLKQREEGAFAEWAVVHGNFYGTPLKPLQALFASGQDVLLDVDVQGAAQLKLSLPHAAFVFILPPSMRELERRLRSRQSDSEEVIVRRLANARQEIAAARWFDHILVNDELDAAYASLRSLYKAATLQTALHRNRMDALLSESLEMHASHDSH
ncbi:MAG TPA: guanylate kinase [Candidatus Desulfovibrio intestinipullorum]|uniref:Guanylate kinase n=1 Tax=Candidatus Desulfovibrio intestinipullorum TaxID=2838536 RepID=A0A9D1TP96_9BACT|nr:guanylate kinase [Candidatus Desulfovibrio intestinipullorum]